MTPALIVKGRDGVTAREPLQVVKPRFVFHREARDRWTSAEDDILADLIADGLSFSEAGRRMGRSKCSCLSRFRKIARDMGAQAI